MRTDPNCPQLSAEMMWDRRRFFFVLILFTFIAFSLVGCRKPAEIETYTIPIRVPDQLQVGKERMLAAMLAKGQSVCFLKVSGPEAAIDEIDAEFRQFVERLEFADGLPSLNSLPQGWRLANNANKQFRFASINIDTATKQLDLSVSQLPLDANWDEQVKMNVNRWRGQLNLPASEQRWAEGQPIEIASADRAAVWVDLLGDPQTASTMMPAPLTQSPNTVADSGASTSSDQASEGRSERATAAVQEPATSQQDSRLKFEKPEGWREGRMSSMRMAAFDVGPDDAVAELTVIPAGGDLRGNVARWLGQIRGGEVSDEVVDRAMSDSRKLNVDGRAAERFLLTGENATEGQAIDATIVPLDNGMSLFIKMTGPVQTVTQQAESIASFLESLKLNL
jgi:hypothetical protein